MNKFLPIIALVTFAAAPGTAPGQVIDHAYQYQACMTLAREAPQEAFETALTWRGLGGGDAKLLGAGAAFTGPFALPVMLALAASSALIGVLLMGKGRIDGTTEIRFGPWLAGAIAAVFILQQIWPTLPL